MGRLVTKCCKAKRDAVKDENGYPIEVFCEQCEMPYPEMEWIETKEAKEDE